MKRILLFLAMAVVAIIDIRAQVVTLNKITYEVTSPGEAVVKRCKITEGRVIIPSRVNINGSSCEVVGIENRFYRGISDVILGNNIRYIGDQAFKGCTNITSVKLPASLKKIGREAFSLCNNLESIVFPISLEEIGANAFLGCNKVSDVILNVNLKKIGANAFNSCDLRKLYIPVSVDSIGAGAFYQNSNLTSIHLPDKEIKYFSESVDGNPLFQTILPGLVFEECNNIESIDGSMQSQIMVCPQLPSTCGARKKLENTFTYYSYARIVDRMEAWKKKSEFETTSQWNARVNEDSWRKKQKEITDELKKEYVEARTPAGIKGSLGYYDADFGVFPVTDSRVYNTVYVKVPQNEAEEFKAKWDKVEVNPVYGVVDDHFGVLSCTFKLKRKVYESTKNYTGDEYRNIDIMMPDFSIDLAENEKAPVVKNNSCEGTDIDRSLDTDIPVTRDNNKNTFAVVLGNEDYKDVADVDFAVNDANVVAEYCNKTLGLPKNNIRTYTNATYGMMITALKDIAQISKAYDGDINVIFYYAGHGIPNEDTHEAFLLPVDVDGTQTDLCLSIDKLYKNLCGLNARQVFVFLDACFSGAQRGDGMIKKARSVALRPRKNVPQGNIIAFTAASDKETAYPYKSKGHGMFTYFMLKKLQETKGRATLGEIVDYVKKNVSQQSVVINKKSQTPSIMVSPSITASWKDMRLK